LLGTVKFRFSILVDSCDFPGNSCSGIATFNGLSFVFKLGLWTLVQAAKDNNIVAIPMILSF
jgi:hypothetical protein